MESWRPGPYQLIVNSTAHKDPSKSSSKTRDIPAGQRVQISRTKLSNNNWYGQIQPEEDWILIQATSKEGKKTCAHPEVRTKDGTILDCRNVGTIAYFNFRQYFRKTKAAYNRMLDIIQPSRKRENFEDDQMDNVLDSPPASKSKTPPRKRKRLSSQVHDNARYAQKQHSQKDVPDDKADMEKPSAKRKAIANESPNAGKHVKDSGRVKAVFKTTTEQPAKKRKLSKSQMKKRTKQIKLCDHDLIILKALEKCIPIVKEDYEKFKAKTKHYGWYATPINELSRIKGDLYQIQKPEEFFKHKKVLTLLSQTYFYYLHMDICTGRLSTRNMADEIRFKKSLLLAKKYSVNQMVTLPNQKSVVWREWLDQALHKLNQKGKKSHRPKEAISSSNLRSSEVEDSQKEEPKPILKKSSSNEDTQEKEDVETILKKAKISAPQRKILKIISGNDPNYFTESNIDNLFDIEGIGEKTLEKLNAYFLKDIPSY